MFPFNWVPQRVGRFCKVGLLQFSWGFHSIGFPSEWGVKKVVAVGGGQRCFHSIGFPSEWGVATAGVGNFPPDTVSIQLGSPASGEHINQQHPLSVEGSFHSIGFPSEWGVYETYL